MKIFTIIPLFFIGIAELFDLPVAMVPISAALSIKTSVTQNILTIWLKKEGTGFAAWGIGTLEMADLFLIEFPNNQIYFKSCLITGISPLSCSTQGPWILADHVVYSNNNWAAKIQRDMLIEEGVSFKNTTNNVVYSWGNNSVSTYGFEGSSDIFLKSAWNIQGQITAYQTRVMTSLIFFFALAF